MAIPLIPSKLFLAVLHQWQIPTTLLLLLVLPVVSLLLITRSSRGSSAEKAGLKLPPGPPRLPVLGNLHQLGGPLPHRSLRELARRHGPVMLLRLGTVPTLVVSSAEAAREVMKAHDADCCSRPVSPGPTRLSYGLKDVVFAPYDGYWREVRKLLIVELVSMRRVRAAWYARQQQVDKLISNLTRAGTKPVELNDHIFGLVDGIVGTVAFGNIYGSEQFAHKKHFQHVLDEAMAMIASFSAEDFFPNTAGRLVDRLTGLVARRERIFEELDAFFEMVIEQHLDPVRAKPENGGDLVDVLIGHWKEHSGTGTLSFTREHVKAIIFDTFIGGISTSSVTMLWAMAELIRKPTMLKKVQDEIRAVVGGKEKVQDEIRAVVGGKEKVQSEDVPELRYLKMVVKETLRLHPPATLLVPRETMRDVKIGGYDVPAKTRVFVNAWAIGRDSASWDNAEEFDPDRFEEKEVDFNGAHFELVPFGAGRRICPGLAMGVTNVEFTLANLLCCFDWALPEGMTAGDVSMEEAGGLTVHKKTPLVLVPTCRFTPPARGN